MEVREIETKETDVWLLEKHYAKRKCQRMHCFGLFDGMQMVGVVTYGMPPSPQVGRGFLGEEHRTKVLELNRLCINDNAPKNSASMLVGRSLKMLPPCAVVSYADGRMGHIGYVYQATNFLYCGAKKSHDCEYLVDGEWTHPKVLTNRGISAVSKWAKENNVEKRRPSPKHRYIYFVDKNLKRFLRYEVEPYPKGETKRYDSQDIITELTINQCSLF